LDVVVPDRVGSRQRLLDVPGLEDREPPLRVMRPYSRQEIGLQFQLHRQRVHLPLVHPTTLRIDLVGDPQQVLDVVSHLVLDHVRLGEVPRRSEPLLQQFVEAQVDVDGPVGRAVERPHRRARIPAPRTHRVVEQHQPRLLVRAPHLREQFAPDVFGVRQHHRHELRPLVRRGVDGHAGLFPPGGAVRTRRRLLQQRARVTPQQQVHDHHDDADAPEPAADHHPPADSPAILDVAAAATSLPEHGASLS